MTAEQRLTTVEGDLEVVKHLLVSAASYAESANQKLDSLTTAQNRTQTQLDQLTQSQSRFDQSLSALAGNQVEERDKRLELKEDLEILYRTVQQSGNNIEQVTKQVDQLTRQVDQLTKQVDQLTQNLTASVQDLVGTIGRLADDAALDRAEMQRIWNYLLHQSGNGNGSQ